MQKSEEQKTEENANTFEILPKIDVAISTEKRLFLNEISKLLMISGDFTVDLHLDAFNQPGFDVLNFCYVRSSPHAGLGGQLIARPEVRGRIAIEMRAAKWSPDPPTREAYCTAARTLVGSALSSYNRTNGTRYRLRIETLNRKKKELSPQSSKLFNRFALLANKSSLHPLDWERFYEFVRYNRQKLSEHYVRDALEKFGFSREKAIYIADIYAHLIEYNKKKRAL